MLELLQEVPQGGLLGEAILLVDLRGVSGFERETPFAIRDSFPVSPGHTLIIPRRHVASLFEVTDAERADLMSLLAAG